MKVTRSMKSDLSIEIQRLVFVEADRAPTEALAYFSWAVDLPFARSV